MYYAHRGKAVVGLVLWVCACASTALLRVSVLRLSKDSHWKCDSYQHLKVTGRPFAMMNNLNDATSTRSFLDEPLEREQVP